jgi:SpoIID/LytB domain protein
VLCTRRALLLASFVWPRFPQGGTAVLLRVKDRGTVFIQNADAARRWVLPPGPTVKPLSLLALIEAGKLSDPDEFVCPQKLILNGRKLACSHPVGLPPMNVSRAIAYSCNCAVAHWALRFAPGELDAALLRAGFGPPLGYVRRNLTGARLPVTGHRRGRCRGDAVGDGPCVPASGTAHCRAFSSADFGGLGRRRRIWDRTAGATESRSTGRKDRDYLGQQWSARCVVRRVCAEPEPRGGGGGLSAGTLGRRRRCAHCRPAFANVFRGAGLIRTLTFLLALTFVCQGQVTYKVRIADRIVTLPAEQYVAAVLARESSVCQNDEALKAMAVAARTYAANLRGRHAREGFDFCSTTHCQRVDLNGITERLKRAAQETAGELLWFDGKPAFAVYTRSCGGEAEDVRAVWPDIEAPYLRVHADPYCLRAGGERWNWTGSPEKIVDALRISHLQAPAPLRRIEVVNRTQSGRNKTLSLEGDNGRTLISASSFRFAWEGHWVGTHCAASATKSKTARIALCFTEAAKGTVWASASAEPMKWLPRAVATATFLRFTIRARHSGERQPASIGRAWAAKASRSSQRNQTATAMYWRLPKRCSAI